MNIFIWNNHNQWSNTFNYIIGELWGECILHEDKKTEISPIIGKEDWIDNFLRSKQISSPKPLVDFTRAIKAHWSHIRVYHACSPQNVETYYRNGIVPSSIKKLDEYAKKILCQYADPATISIILKYMHCHYDEADERVFVAIDKNHLRTFCGHHLLFGSEYFLCCAMILGTMTGKLKDILEHIKTKTITMPTLLSCDVPMEYVPTDVINEISAIILAEGFRMLMSPMYTPPSRRFGFGMSRIIPSSWISKHTQVQIEGYTTYPPVWIDLSQFVNNSIKKGKWQESTSNQIDFEALSTSCQ